MKTMSRIALSIALFVGLAYIELEVLGVEYNRPGTY